MTGIEFGTFVCAILGVATMAEAHSELEAVVGLSKQNP